MKLIYKIIFFAVVVAATASCTKSDDLSGGVTTLPALGTTTWVETAIDKWVQDTLTTPYNMSAQYKWDQFNYNDFTKTLVPPSEDKVEPVLETVKKVWIDTYVEEAGAPFFKAICPKFIVLTGSLSYNPDGSVTLGTAEGGVQIMLYNVNNFLVKGMAGYTLDDSSNLKQMCHVIEHEFGHILNQHILYDQTFKTISAGLYSSNWVNITDVDANRDGFITAYSEAAYDEDFVEMISNMLVNGKDWFDNLVNNIPPGTSVNGITQAQAQKALRDKEASVVNYYKTAWNIDFYSLQTKVRAQLSQLIY
jgi:substrate import-associated zinc metallohydrolase lipoprotein